MAMGRGGGDDRSGDERDKQRTVGEMREDMKRVYGDGDRGGASTR